MSTAVFLPPVSVPTSASAEGRLLARVRSEFTEMPGMNLTAPQARRLFNLSEPQCDAVLARLVAEGYLRRTTEGGYARRAPAP